MPLLRLEAARSGTVEPQLDARADPLVAVARPATRASDSLDARLAALGLRSLADLLAPSSLVIAEDYLALDGQYIRVLAVADLPPFVAAGWLSGVLAEKLALDVSLHVRPLDAGAAAGALKLKSWRSRRGLERRRANGRPDDNHLTTAYEQIEHLRRGLARRETALFSVGLYLQLRASSRAELEALTQRVAGLFSRQSGALLVPRLQQERGFRALLYPEARDPLEILHTLDTGTLSTIYPVRPGIAADAGRASCSGSTSRRTAWWSWTCSTTVSVRTPTLGIFAPSGGGKTFFTKVLARRYLLLTDNTDVIVIDRKHEYRPLCEAMGGQFLRVAASLRTASTPSTCHRRSQRRGVGPAGPHPAGSGPAGCAPGRTRPAPVAERACRPGSRHQGGI